MIMQKRVGEICANVWGNEFDAIAKNYILLDIIANKGVMAEE